MSPYINHQYMVLDHQRRRHGPCTATKRKKKLHSIPVLLKQILCRACRNLIAVITYSLAVSRRPSEHLSWGRSINAGELVVSSPGLFLELGQKGEREGGGRTAPQEEQVLLPLEMLALHLGHEEWLWLTGGMVKRYGLLVVFFGCLLFSGVDFAGGLEMQRWWFVGFGGGRAGRAVFQCLGRLLVPRLCLEAGFAVYEFGFDVVLDVMCCFELFFSFFFFLFFLALLSFAVACRRHGLGCCCDSGYRCFVGDMSFGQRGS